jgi:hypothetical protein
MKTSDPIQIVTAPRTNFSILFMYFNSIVCAS